MKRHKKTAVLCHCILNQNTVVYPLARAKGAFTDILADYISKDYGIYQLPCPELKHLGLKREPMSKDEYDTPEYRSLCEKLAREVVSDLKEMIEYGVELEFLHGINESPTCSITGKIGILMEYLIPMMNEEGINPQFKEVPENY